MALNDFRSAVVAGRARKPVAKPEPVRVPVMHMKSRESAPEKEADRMMLLWLPLLWLFAWLLT